MPRPRPPSLHAEHTRHGKLVWYVRIGKGPRTRLRAAYGSQEFQEEYLAAISGDSPAPRRRASSGTLEWAVMLYKQSTAWNGLSPATRRQRDNIFKRIVKEAGEPAANKFHVGAPDGKHYWLTPPELMAKLRAEYGFTFDPCPYPKPDGFDGLTCEWGDSNYVNPPFGSIIHEGKKKGMTAWVRKALAEWRKGKRVVMVYPLDKWVLMLLTAGAKVTDLGDVRWRAIEDGSAGNGMGRHIACFVLEPMTTPQFSPPAAAKGSLERNG